VHFDGTPVGGRPAHELVDRGIVLVPGAPDLPSLSVEENLLVGAYRGRPGRWTLARVYELFPVLASAAATGHEPLGGEQQMLAIGRGSWQPAPPAGGRYLARARAPRGPGPLPRPAHDRGEGTTTLVVDQNVSQILPLARACTACRKGAVSLEGLPRS